MLTGVPYILEEEFKIWALSANCYVHVIWDGTQRNIQR